MSQKPHQDDPKSVAEGSNRKRPSFRNVVLEVMKLRSFHEYMEPVLEPLIRRVVKEEVEMALKKHLTTMKWNHGKDALPSESRILQLQFLSNISLPVFTGTRIEGDDCNTLKVALIDARTRETVSTGIESLAKVEMVVLEGDFDGEDGDNWSIEEFKNNIVKEREGKKPLITGDVFLNLEDGVGSVGDISFTDNSSWTRSRKFRLGARVVDNCDGIRVREAKTESFIVRDHRGELYKKHYPPRLFDEVWRLEKIGKEGAFHKRLSGEKIKTVKDFLVLHFLDPARLRNILGSGMSAKMWEATVDHARTCELDDRKFYLYCPVPQQRTGVVFNVIGQVLGLLSELNYVSADELSESERVDGHKLVISAFQHPENIVAYEDMVSLVNGTPHYPLNSLITGSCDGSHQVLNLPTNISFDHPNVLTASPNLFTPFYSAEGTSSLAQFDVHGLDLVDIQFDQSLNFQGQVSDSICDTESLPMVLCEDGGHLQYLDTYGSGFLSPGDLHDGGSSGTYNFPCPGTDKAQRRWKMLSSVLKWLSLMLEVRQRYPSVFKPQPKQ